MIARLALGGVLAAILAACDSATEERMEVSSTRAVMTPTAPIPPGAVPRGAAAYAAAASQPPAEPAQPGRGRVLYEAFCTPCHGSTGAGDGPIVRHGYPAPPSFEDERLRAASLEHIVHVIANGSGRMYPMAERIPPADRWAIAAYVKSLQTAGTPEGDAGRESPTP